MRQILNSWRIPLAIFVAAVLVLGAYMLVRGVGSPPSVEASTETALLTAIAARDLDADGLRDWEEVLYGTSPSNPDSFGLGMIDGIAVAKGLVVPKAVADITVETSLGTSGTMDESLPAAPASGTLTAALSQTFLETYLAAKRAKGGADLSQNDIHAIANQVLSSLSTAIVPAPDFKTAKDLIVSGSGPDALRAFAESAEAILVKNVANATTSEVNYLKSALENNDATAPSHIASIAKAYRESASGLSVLPVPQELVAVDLALINAMMRMGEISSDFARVHTDPLATMLALHQYPKAAASLAEAFVDIGKTYQAAGISLPVGAPGASFVNLIANVTAKSRTAEKP